MSRPVLAGIAAAVAVGPGTSTTPTPRPTTATSSDRPSTKQKPGRNSGPGKAMAGPKAKKPADDKLAQTKEIKPRPEEPKKPRPAARLPRSLSPNRSQ
jgi:hypothetical protein